MISAAVVCFGFAAVTTIAILWFVYKMVSQDKDGAGTILSIIAGVIALVVIGSTIGRGFEYLDHAVGIERPAASSESP